MHYEKFADGTVRCIEDEIPFDVPEGWEWCRVGTVFTTITGGTPSTKDRSLYGNEYPFYKPTDLDAGFQVVTADDSVSEKGFLSGRVVLPLSVLVTCIGATIGKTGLIRTAGICNQQINAILPNSLIAPEYTYFFMCSGFGQDQIISNSSATTLPILNKSRFDNLLFALPPYKVQLKIADQIEIIMRYIDAIDCNQADINVLISTTKAHILDLAIRGKLVPQNPDDVPASVLLDRIRAEKEELIKQGKIKRDKRESVIFRGEDNSYYEKIGNEEPICIDDELPFAIPDGWVWCELQDCCYKEIKRGRSPKYADSGRVLSFAQKCNQKTGTINIGLALWIDDSTICRYDDNEYMQDGDIVINSTGTGTLGRVGIYQNTDNPDGIPIVPDSHVTVVRVPDNLDPTYVFYYLKSMQSTLEKMGEGSTNQKELKPISLQQLRIPIPPNQEQKRIVSVVETMLGKLELVETNLI